MNVPALGECTLRRDIAGSRFTAGSEIQVTLISALKIHCNILLLADCYTR